MAPKIEQVRVAAYRVPTDQPESDGTLQWDSTGMVVVWLDAGGRTGMGYSYTHPAAAVLVHEALAQEAEGHDTMDLPGLWQRLVDRARNLGRPGLASMAIAAVDIAAWDLKARLLDTSLPKLLGRVREAVAVYGSGGFTSYSVERLQQQLAGWVESGVSQVKMKVGRDPDADPSRVRAARQAIGSGAQLFVDANGAYDCKQALAKAEAFNEQGVNWFEEPVSSDDLAGLRLLRERVPGAMEVTAGEYGYDEFYFRRMLDAGAVDVLQVDVTRCGGITGFLKAAGLCDAYNIPLSAHTAPAIHAPLCCALPAARHLEYFHDHVRIENMLLDGTVQPRYGVLTPDAERPGHGLTFKERDAERFRA